jgi:hypothetical protein
MLLEILFIALITGAVALWFHMSAVRERALVASKNYCRQMGVQFLDGSVWFARAFV